MKKIIKIVLYLFVGLMIVGMILNEERKDYQILIKKEGEISFFKRELEKEENKNEMQILSLGEKISDTVCIRSLTDEYGQLAGCVKFPVLIYRYTPENCVACVYDDFLIINQLCDSIGHDKVIIIDSNNDLKQSVLVKKTHSLQCKCYTFPNKFNISLECDSVNNNPFYFILDEDLKISYPYVSRAGHTIKSAYFNRVINFFNNTK